MRFVFGDFYAMILETTSLFHRKMQGTELYADPYYVIDLSNSYKVLSSLQSVGKGRAFSYQFLYARMQKPSTC